MNAPHEDYSHELLADLQTQSEEFIAVRRDIHQHPEMGYKEYRTSDLVAEQLEEWGYAVTRGLGGTGVVGQLKRGNGNKSIGLRADMDALPIQEATGLPYASCNVGIMHACGHDGHTAMLLAAAKHIAQNVQFCGTLNLIFQPAEEGLGGAKKMLDDGLFAKFPCDAVFAMHNMPGHPQGQLILRDGPMMASSDNVIVELEGVGGHGALPHRTADPVVAMAAVHGPRARGALTAALHPGMVGDLVQAQHRGHATVDPVRDSGPLGHRALGQHPGHLGARVQRLL